MVTAIAGNKAPVTRELLIPAVSEQLGQRCTEAEQRSRERGQLRSEAWQRWSGTSSAACHFSWAGRCPPAAGARSGNV